MKILKNKGMYIEDLINNSASYYDENKKFYIEKRFLPIIPTKINGDVIIGKLIRKSSVDYNCLFKGRYIDFEVKQTDNEYFDLKKIQKHQILHLKKITEYNGLSFLLIYFFKYDVCYMLNFTIINNFMKNKKTKIHYDDPSLSDFIINIIFPGILDFENFFNKFIK